uniref:Protein kinase domain-containing protein n=1 Tax=Timema bartmani TaxID=61472 RepID=A0A7R9F7S5_9NEOP|nr:unnamed protein product [Timema bartmani]
MGVVLYAMVFGQLPFDDTNHNQLMKIVHLDNPDNHVEKMNVDRVTSKYMKVECGDQKEGVGHEFVMQANSIVNKREGLSEYHIRKLSLFENGSLKSERNMLSSYDENSQDLHALEQVTALEGPLLFSLLLRKLNGDPRHRFETSRADPTFDTPAPIDILIGADLFTQIMTGEQYILGKDLAIAFGSVFGVVLMGPTPCSAPSVTPDNLNVPQYHKETPLYFRTPEQPLFSILGLQWTLGSDNFSYRMRVTGDAHKAYKAIETGLVKMPRSRSRMAEGEGGQPKETKKRTRNPSERRRYYLYGTGCKSVADTFCVLAAREWEIRSVYFLKEHDRYFLYGTGCKSESFMNTGCKSVGEWKREKRKRLRVAGKSYINSKGDLVQERKIGEDCRCRRKCYQIVAEEQRHKLFDGYYALNSHDEQNAYLFGLIRKHDIARKRHKDSDRRTCSYKYFVRIRGKEVQICRLAFAHIHGISPHKIRILCQKQDQNIMFPRDGRGRHENRPRKISEETLNSSS